MIANDYERSWTFVNEINLQEPSWRFIWTFDLGRYEWPVLYIFNRIRCAVLSVS